MYFSNSKTLLARNDDVATKPQEVRGRKCDDLVLLLQCREEGFARGGEGAWNSRDEVNAFRTGPREGKGKGTIVLDRPDLTGVVAGRQNLAAERPEA